MRCRCAGSPFQPYVYEGQKLIPGQANNVLMCAAGPSCMLQTLPPPHHTKSHAPTTGLLACSTCRHEYEHGDRNFNQRHITMGADPLAVLQ